MSTHAYIADIEIVQRLHPENLVGDTLLFFLIIFILMMFIYLYNTRFFSFHHQ